VLELGPFSGGISFELAARFPSMEITVADDNRGYLEYLKNEIARLGLSHRIRVVDGSIDRLPLADASFDLIILRGAFFFIMDKPSILSEIHRVLASGGLAFVGGGYGKGMSQKEIEAIAEESRVLNDRLGRRHVALDELKSIIESQSLAGVTQISEEGGVWLLMRKPVEVRSKTARRAVAAFDVKPGDMISTVGGGGKTSLMFALAKELSAGGKKVITTTTTRIMPPSADESPCLVADEDESRVLSQLKKELARHAHVTAALMTTTEGKLKGLAPETLEKIRGLGLADYIINEADGAARKPVKAPNATEPVVPAGTTLVIAVVGMDALGQRLSPDIAFRPELVSKVTALAPGDKITSETIATLMTDEHGIIQNAPAGARIVPFINKAELGSDGKVAALARAILARRHPQIERVVAGSLMSKPGEFQVFRLAKAG
jgi:probable selenium-dependent hydroxylase accessory protein YqeC